MKNTDKQKIGFIGQGWIGKNYADDFENRGFSVIRYALEEPYVHNKDQIANCFITFIAVPTPTRPSGFDDSFLRDALKVIAPKNVAVIKSTTTVGLVEKLQTDYPDIIILHSPEFLVEKTASYDASNPKRNIIGLPHESSEHRLAAEKVLAILPEAPYSEIMTARESELVKYAGNCFLFTKVVFMNILYDFCEKSGVNFETVRQALINDPRIGESHTNPVHNSGRGAGGHCFIKDFEAFRLLHKELIADEKPQNILDTMVTYNKSLLTNSGKDLDLLEEVYGDLP